MNTGSAVVVKSAVSFILLTTTGMTIGKPQEPTSQPAVAASQSLNSGKELVVPQMIAQLNAIVAKLVTLDDGQRLKLDDIATAMRKKYAADMTESKAEEFFTDYVARVNRILTPEQRAVYGPRMEIARRAAIETKHRVQCAANLKQIGSALLLYSNEHRNAYPADLGALMNGDYFNDAGVFLCPNSHKSLPWGFKKWDAAKRAKWINENTDYIYRGGHLNNSEPPEKVIVYEKPENHVGTVSTNDEGGGNILFGDGHVDFLKATDFARVVKEGIKKAEPPAPLR